LKKLSTLKNLFLILSTSGLTYFDVFTRPLYAIPEPITVAVTKVLDRSNAPWFRKNFEDKFKTILSTELASAGHFIVIERDPEALKELREESILFESSDDLKKIELVKPKYIIRAVLSDYEDNYVSFDLKVINVKTAAIAYSRSIEGKVSNGLQKQSIEINKNNFSYKEKVEINKKTVPSRAIRAAINEIAGYLDCVLYLKDECLAEYEAKEERRKRSNESLDFF